MGHWDDCFEPRGAPENDSTIFDDVKVMAVSDKALLVKFPRNASPHWVPRSQISGGNLQHVKGATGQLHVTDWLREKWEEEGFDPERTDPEDQVIINAVCLRESDKALQVRIGNQVEWIPKSQIGDESEVTGDGDAGKLVLSSWLAEAKGFTGAQPNRARNAQDDLDADDIDA